MERYDTEADITLMRSEIAFMANILMSLDADDECQRLANYLRENLAETAAMREP